MNYIVLDLEWNQCPGGKAKEKPGLPFEIVEIGAMKLSEDRKPLDSFNEMIRPQIYRKFHYRTKEIVHMDMEELQRARTFPGGKGFSGLVRRGLLFLHLGASGSDGITAQHEVLPDEEPSAFSASLL